MPWYRRYHHRHRRGHEEVLVVLDRIVELLASIKRSLDITHDDLEDSQLVADRVDAPPGAAADAAAKSPPWGHEHVYHPKKL